jgi:anhydro-N-acetylmuramic acid kinase
MNPALYIGLISGTSMDAVDCALVDCAGNVPRLVDFINTGISADLKQRLLQLTTNSAVDLRQLGSTDVEVAELFATAVSTLLAKQNLKPGNVIAIGSHGQTIWHEPPQSAQRKPFTLQIGDPSTLAERTGITVVADFRRKDMAAGGQGAPLVPALHQELFHSEDHDRIALNLGGIANITLLPKNRSTSLGLDTGPASVLMDAWIKRHLNLDFDEDGAWASSGRVDANLLSKLLDEPYFSMPAPKSTGREFLNIAWLDNKIRLAGKTTTVDVQATLLEFTVQTIRNEIVKLLTAGEIIACGGGARNSALLRRLQAVLPDFSVRTSTALGIHGDCVEAVAFAWLAKKTLNREPVDFTPFTGARHPVIAGGVYYRE